MRHASSRAPFSQLKRRSTQRPADATAAPPAPAAEVPAPEARDHAAQTPPPPRHAEETPPPRTTCGDESVVEEILAGRYSAAPTPQGARAATCRQTPPARGTAAGRLRSRLLCSSRGDYVEQRLAQARPEEKVSAAEEPVPAAPRSLDSTQTIAPIAAAGRVAGRERRAVCPECYAPNPEGNSYCQECGNALPVTSGRPAAAARPAPAQAAPQKTTVMPPADQAGTAALPAYFTAR